MGRIVVYPLGQHIEGSMLKRMLVVALALAGAGGLGLTAGCPAPGNGGEGEGEGAGEGEGEGGGGDGESCATAAELTAGGTVHGDTTGKADDAAASCTFDK